MAIGSALALLAVLGALALALGVVALYVFAFLTGWRRLARRFPAAASAPGERTSSAGVLLGTWGWNAPPLRVLLDDTGVLLEPRQPFPIAFAAVRLPWTAILAVGPRVFMLFDVVEIRYGAAPDATLGFVAGPAADAIARAAVAHGAAPLPSR